MTDARVAGAPGISRSLAALFAVAGGAAVGSLYYAQPLLAVIAADLGVPEASVGALVTATQVGYAAGILLLVPLGDLRDRRRMIPLMMLLSAGALVACAAAPSLPALGVALAVVGVTTVAGQLLTPLAGDLAAPEQRGAVVGTVVSGLITGILAARVLAGLVSAVGGWRPVFLVGAGVAAVLAVALHRAIPPLPRQASALSYRAALASVARFAVRERTLQLAVAFGATGFAIFTMSWTALTLLLSAPPYGYPTWAVGLVGVAGAAGAVAAQRAGRLTDRGWSTPALGLAWVLVLLSWVLSWLGGQVLAVLLLSLAVRDVGTQTQNVVNLSRVLALDPAARSRLNSAYIAGNFVGGAAGSVLATLLWSAGGWPAVCLAGGVLSAAALALWAATRHGPALDAAPARAAS